MFRACQPCVARKGAPPLQTRWHKSRSRGDGSAWRRSPSSRRRFDRSRRSASSHARHPRRKRRERFLSDPTSKKLRKQRVEKSAQKQSASETARTERDLRRRGSFPGGGGPSRQMRPRKRKCLARSSASVPARTSAREKVASQRKESGRANC